MSMSMSDLLKTQRSARNTSTPLRLITMIGLTLLVSTNVGCFTAIKQTFSEFRGAKGEVLINQDLEGRPFATVGSVQIRPTRTRLAEKLCSTEMLDAMRYEVLNAQSYLRSDFRGDGQTLVIDTEVLYFAEKTILGSALLLVWLEFRVDEKLVADGILRIDSNAFSDDKPEELAEAGLEALRQFVLLHKLGPPDNN